MEQFIRQTSEFQRLYNCSFYDISAIPLERRVNVPIGVFVMSISLIEEVKNKSSASLNK